jgi:hypothetical protein
MAAMFKRTLLVAAAILIPVAAVARDCGQGTISANYQRFHSPEFAGRLAMHRWLTIQIRRKAPNCIVFLMSQEVL